MSDNDQQTKLNYDLSERCGCGIKTKGSYDLTHCAHLGQLALLFLFRSVTRRCPLTISWSRPLASAPVLAPLLHVPRQVVDQLVQGEDAEADFVVGRFRAALEEAGESHGGRRPGGGG